MQPVEKLNRIRGSILSINLQGHVFNKSVRPVPPCSLKVFRRLPLRPLQTFFSFSVRCFLLLFFIFLPPIIPEYMQQHPQAGKLLE